MQVSVVQIRPWAPFHVVADFVLFLKSLSHVEADAEHAVGRVEATLERKRTALLKTGAPFSLKWLDSQPLVLAPLLILGTGRRLPNRHSIHSLSTDFAQPVRSQRRHVFGVDNGEAPATK